MKNRHWSDNDKHFWPFTYSKDGHAGLAILIDSGDCEYPGCYLRLSLCGRTLILELPPIIRPWRKQCKANWDEATVRRMGRNWYWDEHSRAFGFSVVDDTFSLLYGAQTMDSSTEKMKCWFIPWLQWRFVRFSVYDRWGQHFWTSSLTGPKDGRAAILKIEQCPSITCSIRDNFDGEELEADTIIEEREWHFGTGWFKWLSRFYAPHIDRSLDIRFSKEVGPRKGSWKGGTLGHGIAMDSPYELHETAMKRYCEQHNLTYLGTITTIGPKPK